LSSKQYSIHLILNNSTEWEYIRKERVTKKGFLVSHNEGISTPKPKDGNRLQIASQIYTSKLKEIIKDKLRDKTLDEAIGTLFAAVKTHSLRFALYLIDLARNNYRRQREEAL
jgi:hypothetical protein